MNLPGKVVAAAMLFTDIAGRVLLVEPVYKNRWELPGGVVEEFEAPMAAAGREVAEELGLSVGPGRLLVVDYSPVRPDRPIDLVAFVFDGGRLSAADLTRVVLGEDELRDFRFCSLAEADALLAPVLARRVRAAAAALADGTTAYLEDGRPSGPRSPFRDDSKNRE